MKKGSGKRATTVSKTVIALLDAIVANRGGRTHANVIADLESPRWPQHESDWSWYVPQSVRELWGSMSLEARAAVRVSVSYLRDVD